MTPLYGNWKNQRTRGGGKNRQALNISLLFNINAEKIVVVNFRSFGMGTIWELPQT